MDSLRIKISFFVSLTIHVFFLIGLNIFPKKEPIIISFPVELINIVPEEKIEKKSVSQPVIKKEEIIIPRKEKKVAQTLKPLEQKKKIKKSQEQVQSKPVSETAQTMMLENIKFPFSYYIKQVQNKISENWSWAQNYAGNFKTVVYFRIIRSGQISEIKIKTSSGNKLYDNICLRAVEVSAPFPPLPQGYEDDWLGVFFEFRYKD